MHIADILSMLWRRKWVIGITLAVCLVVTIAVTVLTPPTYVTVATLRVLTPGTGLEGGTSWVNTQFADRMTATYIPVLYSSAVTQDLLTRLGLTSYEELPAREISPLPGTELLEIRFYDSDPRYANELANIVVENPGLLFGDFVVAFNSLQERLGTSRQRLTDLRSEYDALFDSANPNRNALESLRQQISLEEQNFSQLSSQFNQSILRLESQRTAVSLVQPALPPQGPIRPQRTMNIAIGALAGLIGGLALAVLFENFDNAMYSTRQIEKVAGNRIIIGQIPRGKRQRGVPLRLNEPAVLEGYRWLRANVLSGSSSYRTVLITSAMRGEGKSSVAANLAATIAQTNRSVLLIDGNLRKPTLHETFGVTNSVGFSDVLVGNVQPEEAWQKLGDFELYLMPSGSSLEPGTDLLSSERARSVLRQLGRQYDIVLIDSPAAEAYSDAATLAPVVDGVIVVVERNRTEDFQLRNLLASLDNVKATVAGLVVNRAEMRATSAYPRMQMQRPTPIRETMAVPRMDHAPANGHEEASKQALLTERSTQTDDL
jgi:capsular exopolysaccharide synthesis family protein